ncbi:MAG: AAA family ATPase [Lentisphaeria bacterium]|jgi:predicted ATPase|nr:AAA family ATPase [Lentisphaeria bacterium]
MITDLKVSNFRSLGEDVHVRFGNFTVLVGPNGSGKSNVVDALRFVADALQMGLSGAVTMRHGIGAVRRWIAGHPFNLAIEVQVSFPQGYGRYEFELTGAKAEEYRVIRESAEVWGPAGQHRFRIDRGEWKEGPDGLRPPIDDTSLALNAVGGDVRFKPLVHELQGVAIYSIFPDTLRVPQKYSPLKPMSRHGDNWVSILRDQPKDTWKPDLIVALERLTGDIIDLKVSPAASYLVAQFRHRSDTKVLKWFDGAQESDGTLRFAGIITALLQDPPVPVIGIEEPELTIHPGAVPLLVDYLKDASKRSQVIVTTHSPELLDRVDESDVRVVQRIDGVSAVATLHHRQLEAVRRGLLTLGELVRTEGLEQAELLPDASAG